MARPEGSLTAAQHEILEAVWNSGAAGLTVSEVWGAVSETRAVGRTTVLNLVDRLEKRGWLRRVREPKGANRYVAALDRVETSERLASEFVDDFFGGSATDLVMSLIGTRRLESNDVARLRALLDESGRGEDAS